MINKTRILAGRKAVDTDQVTYKFPVPSDYAGESIVFSLIWTNDDD